MKTHTKTSLQKLVLEALDIQYRKATQQLQAQLDAMVAGMMRCQTDKTLQALLVSKMARLVQQESTSYQQVGYLQNLQQWILEQCEGSCTGDMTGSLYRQLIRTNFNASSFIAYCKARIEEELAGIAGVESKYIALCKHERDFGHLIYKKKSLKFEPGLADVKTVMLRYVRTELAYLKKIHESIVVKMPPVAAPLQADKIAFSFSVDALAYFFKLLVNAGVVVAEPKSQLFRFVAKVFTTPGTADGGIAEHSFTNKYNQTVQATAKIVRAALVRMLRLVDKEFDLA
ncbi:hypothetical protein [Pedobacter heparinus]|uniref:Uncharacterized protein n=1 Tax=Pedobacter heparinus (strain ATCC 13125 / DSM 2366 / CIP 104194 / JCM 7457 / NBRC 12017 / NCIMB 9290 / NRRL B-14731 / HIM 762-3) TaxID=485917 RepID=C6Y2T2_PEDHD|nr:hypothetical protein [Pedobacter heparinus]ACU03145.1 hypothetical protein Phep_0923 [Pedobacter heparinus DSM 2366]